MCWATHGQLGTADTAWHDQGTPLHAQAQSCSAHAFPSLPSPESHIVAYSIPGPTSWVRDGHFALGLTLPRMSLAVSHLAVPPRLCFPYSVTVKLFFPSVSTSQAQEGRWGHLCQVPLTKSQLSQGSCPEGTTLPSSPVLKGSGSRRCLLHSPSSDRGQGLPSRSAGKRTHTLPWAQHPQPVAPAPGSRHGQ